MKNNRMWYSPRISLFSILHRRMFVGFGLLAPIVVLSLSTTTSTFLKFKKVSVSASSVVLNTCLIAQKLDQISVAPE